jgi:hypothetical protein
LAELPARKQVTRTLVDPFTVAWLGQTASEAEIWPVFLVTVKLLAEQLASGLGCCTGNLETVHWQTLALPEHVAAARTP